ncbi:MAG: valine--tRNA ligase [candidate division WOR-3 bacterium]|nr:valine--tRNA ligase [candidate division WOR-3 bacterium]
MDKHFDYVSAQTKWNKVWREKKSFHSEPDNRDPYTIVIPPPNVTDILHLGHALNNTIQDILIRYHRNKGFNAEWIPGTDHAGIATQVVVEKKLRKEGMDRKEMGKEAFLTEIRQWVDSRKNRILQQLEGIGASCDWDKKKFTLDNDMSKAVATVFKLLYEEGYIYRGTYIVNWCPACHTALSDEEVEHDEQKGKLYYIKYPLKDSDEYITVATTRPETMLGDSGIAVNPQDEKNRNMIGKTVILPLMNREIPVVADDFVNTEFGTGFVKVTPAHDSNDFDMGKRHDLEEIVIMDTNGIINSNGGKYKGMTREEARERIMDDLKEMDLVDKIEDYENAVGKCYRCKTIVEPYLSEQWFVKMKDLAKPALDVSGNGDINFYPGRWKGVYDHWLENIRDWCISRQLWWGHRIPVYYCNECYEEFVSVNEPRECPQCGSEDFRQDENVLDTWFSSWLWPFSTMGWPEETDDYRYYYPTEVIVSASEILFFWIARMIMAGLHFTGRLPFEDIYIHGTVRDKNGIKMSKSLGNGIDPLEITEEYGADALRFSIVYISGQGKDPNVARNTFELGRNFANKIWNAARFILLNAEETEIPGEPVFKDYFDKWITGRLAALTDSVENNIAAYRFSDYAKDVYDFFWHDFCDWYLEIIKIQNKSMETAIYVLANFLKLLNPLMPYISEELNEILGSELMIHQKIITSPVRGNDENFENMDMFRDLVSSIRNIISETGIKRISVYAGSGRDLLENYRRIITELSGAESLEFIDSKQVKGIPGIFSGGMIFIAASDIDNIEDHIGKYEEEKDELEKQLKKLEKTLSSRDFLNKAPPDVIERMKEKQDRFTEKKHRIEYIINSIR